MARAAPQQRPRARIGGGGGGGRYGPPSGEAYDPFGYTNEEDATPRRSSSNAPPGYNNGPVRRMGAPGDQVPPGRRRPGPIQTAGPPRGAPDPGPHPVTPTAQMQPRRGQAPQQHQNHPQYQQHPQQRQRQRIVTPTHEGIASPHMSAFTPTISNHRNTTQPAETASVASSTTGSSSVDQDWEDAEAEWQEAAGGAKKPVPPQGPNHNAPPQQPPPHRQVPQQPQRRLAELPSRRGNNVPTIPRPGPGRNAGPKGPPGKRGPRKDHSRGSNDEDSLFYTDGAISDVTNDNDAFFTDEDFTDHEDETAPRRRGAGGPPPGAMPPGAMPPGAMPPGAMPPGAMHLGAMPPGAIPPGALPPGALPAPLPGQPPLMQGMHGRAPAPHLGPHGHPMHAPGPGPNQGHIPGPGHIPRVGPGPGPGPGPVPSPFLNAGPGPFSTPIPAQMPPHAPPTQPEVVSPTSSTDENPAVRYELNDPPKKFVHPKARRAARQKMATAAAAPPPKPVSERTAGYDTDSVGGDADGRGTMPSAAPPMASPPAAMTSPGGTGVPHAAANPSGSAPPGVPPTGEGVASPLDNSTPKSYQQQPRKNKVKFDETPRGILRNKIHQYSTENPNDAMSVDAASVASESDYSTDGDTLGDESYVSGRSIESSRYEGSTVASGGTYSKHGDSMEDAIKDFFFIGSGKRKPKRRKPKRWSNSSSKVSQKKEHFETMKVPMEKSSSSEGPRGSLHKDMSTSDVSTSDFSATSTNLSSTQPTHHVSSGLADIDEGKELLGQAMQAPSSTRDFDEDASRTSDCNTFDYTVGDDTNTLGSVSVISSGTKKTERTDAKTYDGSMQGTIKSGVEQPLRVMTGWMNTGLEAMGSICGINLSPLPKTVVFNNEDNLHNKEGGEDGEKGTSEWGVPFVVYFEDAMNQQMQQMQLCGTLEEEKKEVPETSETQETREIPKTPKEGVKSAPVSVEKTPAHQEPGEIGLVELVKFAAKTKHDKAGVSFDESQEIDVVNEVRFVVVTTSLPLGLIFKDNPGGCYVSRVFKSGKNLKTVCGDSVEVCDQLTAINGQDTAKKSVSEVCGILAGLPNPKEVELSFVRFTGPIATTQQHGSLEPVVELSTNNINNSQLFLEEESSEDDGEKERGSGEKGSGESEHPKQSPDRKKDKGFLMGLSPLRQKSPRQKSPVKKLKSPVKQASPATQKSATESQSKAKGMSAITRMMSPIRNMNGSEKKEEEKNSETRTHEGTPSIKANPKTDSDSGPKPENKFVPKHLFNPESEVELDTEPEGKETSHELGQNSFEEIEPEMLSDTDILSEDGEETFAETLDETILSDERSQSSRSTEGDTFCDDDSHASSAESTMYSENSKSLRSSHVLSQDEDDMSFSDLARGSVQKAGLRSPAAEPIASESAPKPQQAAIKTNTESDKKKKKKFAPLKMFKKKKDKGKKK